MRASFPLQTLPPFLEQFVSQAADTLGCDPSFVALPCLSALAAAVGNSRNIQLKTSWTEPCIVWSAIVAPPGAVKTPAIRVATEPLWDIQAHARQQVPRSTTRTKRGRDKDHGLFLVKTAPDDLENLPGMASAISPGTQYIMSDVSIAKLATTLEANPRGLLVVSDELAGWVENINKRMGGSHWLSIHSAQPLSLDRANCDRVFVPRATVSLCGGIQPRVLKRVLLSDRHRESGLSARFLLSYPDTKTPRWSDQRLPVELKARYAGLFERLFQLHPLTSPSDPFEPQTVRLEPSARQLFAEFYDASAREQDELENEDLQATWPKLRGYAGRLALLLLLARWAEGQDPDPPTVIGETTMQAAIALVRWFGEEAKRVYAQCREVVHRPRDDVGDIVALIQAHEGKITANDLRRARRGINTGDAAEEILQQLVDIGLGSWTYQTPSPKGGRPTRVFRLRDDETHENTGNRTGFVDTTHINE